MELWRIANDVLCHATEFASLLRAENDARKRGDFRRAAEFAELVDGKASDVRVSLDQLPGTRK